MRRLFEDEPWDAQERIQEGIDAFDVSDGLPWPAAGHALFCETGIDSFVFGEMWKRPGLDQRSRRWITLVGVSESCAVTPIKTHFYAALASGNCTPDELQEFVLHYAVHGGVAKGVRHSGRGDPDDQEPGRGPAMGRMKLVTAIGRSRTAFIGLGSAGRPDGRAHARGRLSA